MLEAKCREYIERGNNALERVKISVPEESFLWKAAHDFIEMCKNYLSDASFFYNKGDFENSLAASSYAYAWLDAGVRIGLLEAKGDYVRFTQYS
ncbi:MAG: DUF357 domain-containing protein [Thermoplasmatales archaeon]